MKSQKQHRHHLVSKRTALSLAISQLVLGSAISLPAYAQDKQTEQKVEVIAVKGTYSKSLEQAVDMKKTT